MCVCVCSCAYKCAFVWLCDRTLGSGWGVGGENSQAILSSQGYAISILSLVVLTIQFLSVYLWVVFVLLYNTHTHTQNCCLSKCGLSVVKFHIHKLFYCIPLSTCLCSHLHKHFVVQIVSFCPTHAHSTLVDIVVCLVHLCLHENLSGHTHTQSVVLQSVIIIV